MFSFSPNTRARSNEVNQNFIELGNGTGDVNSNRLQLFRSEVCFDFVQSGLIWSLVSGLNGTMTSGVAYVADASSIMERLAVSSIASRAYTASKDTYVDLGADGTIYYSEVANNATAPTLSANRMRIALMVTNVSTITTVFQTEQRQANTTLTDLGWAGLDNLGNPVRNTSPTSMEFRVTRHNGSATRSNIVAGGVAIIPNMSFNYRSGRHKEKVIYDFGAMAIFTSLAGTHQMWVATDGTLLFPQLYIDRTAGQWGTHQISTVPTYLNANTSVAVTLRATQGQTVNYVNASTDQQYQMPTVIVKVTKAGS